MSSYHYNAAIDGIANLFNLRVQHELNNENIVRVYRLVYNILSSLTNLNTSYRGSLFTTRSFRIHRLQLQKTNCLLKIKLLCDSNAGTWLVPYFKLIIEHIDDLQKIQ